MNEDILKKIKMMTAIILFLSVFHLAAKKAELIETIDPPSENNIICFAALNKWVCAPADQQEKAKQKAMNLALEQSKSNDLDINSSEAVQIQTIQTNDIGKQVEELPLTHPNQASLNDFAKREEVIEQPPQNELESTFETGDTNSITRSAVEPSRAQDNLLASTDESREFQLATTDFGYWRNNYADQWTFQVIGTSNRLHLDQFLINNQLTQTNHSIVKTQTNGADWWVVLSGLYASREEALSQRNVLPEALAQGAWIRQIKTIEGQTD